MSRSETNKREEVTRLLQEAILCGRLKPGTRLPEIRMGRELGVSQAIVREALRELESRGLIVKKARHGSYVIELNADDLVHIYQVRRELESLACALAAQEFQPQTREKLQSCIANMRMAASHNDFIAYARADVQFHRSLWASQSNRFLEKSLEAICLPLFAYDEIQRATTTALDYERNTRQHELILSALQTRDPERVTRLMRHMMQRWLRIHLREYERFLDAASGANGVEADVFAYLRSQASWFTTTS